MDTERGEDQHPELKIMIEEEPNFPEDEKSLEIIEKTARAWHDSQRQQSPKNQLCQKSTEQIEQSQTQDELSLLISAFTSPVPDSILVDYNRKTSKKLGSNGSQNESALENIELKGPAFREFTVHIFQSISFLQNLEPIDEFEILCRMIDLPFTKPGIKRTIIFDLDETLAHCVRQENPARPPDVYLDITVMSGKVLKAGFNIRPFTRECLELVNKDFEVVVFTASHKWYADVILDYIDPEKKLIQHRIYRDNCIKTTGNVYIKDLRVFKNRDLKDMIIVDNAVYSFGAQLSNGIPIIPFKDDKDDKEFICLMNYLTMIKNFDDMRVLNKDAFKMEQVHQFKLNKYIQYYDYDLCDERSDDDDDCRSTGEFADQIQDQEQLDNNFDPFNLSGGSTRSSQQSSSMGSQHRKKLPRQINDCLDEFSLKMAKAKSFHATLSNQRLVKSNSKEGTQSLF